MMTTIQGYLHSWEVYLQQVVHEGKPCWLCTARIVGSDIYARGDVAFRDPSRLVVLLAMSHVVGISMAHMVEVMR